MSLPAPPDIVSLPVPPFNVSAPAPPARVSLPAPPVSVLAALFPVSVFASLLPVALIADEPLKVRFSTLEPRVQVTEDDTKSVPALLPSVTVSEVLST